MRKHLLLLTVQLSFWLCTPVIAQSTANTFSVDLAYSALSDQITNAVTHRERSYLFGLGFHLSNQWSAALKGTIVRSNTQETPDLTTTAHLVGLSAEFDILPQSNTRLYATLGVATGNYCTCGRALPTIRPNLTYARYGAGTSIHLLKGVQLTLAFESNAIVNDIPDAYSYNIMSIGLRHNNWLRIGKKR